MPKRKQMGQRIPEIVQCPQCKRNLLAASYGGYPPEGVPKERQLRRQMPGAPSFSIACTCGYYTRFTPWSVEYEEKVKQEAREQVAAEKAAREKAAEEGKRPE